MPSFFERASNQRLTAKDVERLLDPDVVFGGVRVLKFDYEDGLAVRWHVAGKDSEVIIDPRIQFGAPSVDGVPTWAIKGRWEAGEDLADIADDFGISRALLRKALTFEGVDIKAERTAWKP